MATVKRRTDTDEWEVRWSERVVESDGQAAWKDRRRKAPTKRAAEELRVDVERQLALTGRWVPSAEARRRTLGELLEEYVTATATGGAPVATVRSRASLLVPFGRAYGARPITELTVGLLRDYAASLPSAGRQAATRHRQVLEVEHAWTWAAKASEDWPGLPWPQSITGTMGEVRPPEPVVALGAPTWADVDGMIAQLGMEWHQRAALLMRYTGLRASQAVGLGWRDLEAERGLLYVRSGRVGAKRGRTRVVPLHEALVAELTSWPRTGPLVFPRRYADAQGQARTTPHRGDVLVEPFRTAWERAGVARERWDIPPDDPESRGHGSPTHAIRRCIRSQLLRAEVPEAVVLYLVGQSQGVTGAAYVPEHSPEESPWWPHITRAVAGIPPHTHSLALARARRQS